MTKLRAVFGYPTEGEHCRDCGRLVMDCVGFTWWHAPDDLWVEVWGNEGGILCPPCFTTRSSAIGKPVHYEAVPGL